MDKNHIKRELFGEIKAHINNKEISIIVGPRQVGKTTLMKELVLYIQKIGGKTVFLNLDYEMDKVHLEAQDGLISKLRLEFGINRGYVFIDEIQRKKNAGLFLKGLYDMDLPYKFIVSGSGSLELKESIHESLAGRKRMFELWVWSAHWFEREHRRRIARQGPALPPPTKQHQYTEQSLIAESAILGTFIHSLRICADSRGRALVGSGQRRIYKRI